MPAQSPTLSPTLSAITAGLRGSSSGMPASILPTRSAPTSARLGEDAAAQTGEDGDQRAAEAEADERVDGLLLAAVEDQRQHAVVAGDAEQREADHEHAGDGAAAEGDVERRADAAAGRLGHAGVGAHRHVHADEAGGARERRRRSRSRWRPRCPGARISAMNRTTPTTGDRSCTGGSGRPGRPPGRRRRCAASLVAGREREQRAAWSAAP